MEIAADKAISRCFARLDIIEIPSAKNYDTWDTPFVDVTFTSVKTPQNGAIYLYRQAIIKCIPLTLYFAQVDQTWS